MSAPPVCMHCGQPAVPAKGWNRLPDGRPCPLCRERLLESLPPLLPGLGRGLPEAYGGIGAVPWEPTVESAAPGPDDPIAG